MVKPLLPFALALVLLAAPAFGEAATGKLPQFEVATIKPVDPKVGHMVGVNVYPGGRVVINGLSLKALIRVAFDLSYWQISGGEEWTDKIAYSVEAEPPAEMRAKISNLRHTLFGISDEHLRQMLQALLIDRFGLQFHWGKKTGKVYLLETSGKAVRLKPAADATFGSIGFAEHWVLSNASMPQLAKFASQNVLHCPVLDRTGLTGAFDYKSPAEPWDAYQADPTGSFLHLVREIGLTLKPAKGPVETFVIDAAHKPSPD
jgi:uncharacterized protein (TIGR03435 family)